VTSQTDEVICTSDRHGDAVVVRLTGTVDYATVRRVCGALERAFADLSARAVIVDLSEVEFLGSAGIGALVDAVQARRDGGVETLRVVVDDTRPVIRPIQLTGLDHVLPLYHSLDDALRDRSRWTGPDHARPGTSP
jgi:anti-sigma B factor antagonist